MNVLQQEEVQREEAPREVARQTGREAGPSVIAFRHGSARSVRQRRLHRTQVGAVRRLGGGPDAVCGAIAQRDELAGVEVVLTPPMLAARYLK